MELILLVALAALFAWISYTMSETRGRNSILWVVVTLLLSPLAAWILLLIMGDTDEMAAKKVADIAQTLKTVNKE